MTLQKFIFFISLIRFKRGVEAARIFKNCTIGMEQYDEADMSLRTLGIAITRLRFSGPERWRHLKNLGRDTAAKQYLFLHRTVTMQNGKCRFVYTGKELSRIRELSLLSPRAALCCILR